MKKRFLALALALCLCMSLLPKTALADEGGEYSGKTVILYTSNIRGDIDQYLQVSAAKEAYESAGADVILVDSGDFLQGTKYSAYHNGANIIPLLGTVGYDVVAIGAHEFDFFDGSIGASAHASEGENAYQKCDSIGTMLTASSVKAVSNMSGSNDVFPSGSYSAYTVVQHGGGLRVGVYGLTSPRTATMINEDWVSGISFSNSTNVPEGLASQADLIVCLSNAGVGATVYNAGGTDIVIDATVDGRFSCGAYIVDNSTKAIEHSDSLPAGAADAAVQTAVESAKSDADDAFGSRVATSTVVMQGTNRANRAGETNTGDLVTDALLWYAQSGKLQDKIDDPYYTSSVLNSSNGGILVDDDHIVALWNGGNLRGYMYEGDVTVTDLRRILPYPNTISVVYMTGAQLLEQLEACSEGLPYSSSTYSLCASFMQAAGIDYTVNTKPDVDGTGTAYTGGFGNYKMIKTVTRVTINKINGQAFSLTDLYAVVTHDKNVENGMDASYVMKAVRHGASSVPGYQGAIDSTQTDKTVVTAYDCYNVVMDYILDQLGGNLGSTYSSAHGRIHFTSVSPTLPITTTPDGGTSATVTPSVGSTVSLGDVSINIPPGALKGTSGVEVTIQKPDSPPAAPSGFTFLGVVYEFRVGGSTSYEFSKPVTLTFTFDPASLAPGQTPSVYYYDQGKNEWVNLGGAVSGNKITVTVGHFTKFAVLARKAEEKEKETPPTVPAQAFSDLPASHWAFGVINELSSRGIFTGYPDGTFRPDSSITRAEFAALLVKALGLAPATGSPVQFQDVPADAWFHTSVAAATYAGLANGLGDGTFGPNALITREQMAVMIVKALENAGYATSADTQALDSFGDKNSIDGWALQGLAKAVKAGVVHGMSDTAIAPLENATRAQAAAMIQTLLQLTGKLQG